ncbi:Formate/nitrite transporter-domain-containing protein [Tribonema minus]|uniref:Formate/nitrite transporter-domain-containing protein n=1 Tax=Tribonema minus TaxID=303371 RepID=A0A836CED6_9STRA|nr:Formate/nitrite transporter-domain-containing protein [Tribonema minus]
MSAVACRCSVKGDERSAAYGVANKQQAQSHFPSTSTQPMLLLSPSGLYDAAVGMGTKKSLLPFQTIFFLGILSGCHIGFGALLTVGGNVPAMAAENPGLQKFLIGAVGLPYGLFMTVVTGGELFTSNAAFLAASVLERKATFEGLLKAKLVSQPSTQLPHEPYVYNYFGSLLSICRMPAGMLSMSHHNHKNGHAINRYGGHMSSLALQWASATLPPLQSWVVSYIGNFIGALLLAGITSASETVPIDPIAQLAIAKTSESFAKSLLRGVLCNWLVCMAAYMSLGASDAAGKFVCVFLPVSLFVTIGADHCVANMFLVSAAMMVTLGNIIGGAIMVSCMFSLGYGVLNRLITQKPRP